MPEIKSEAHGEGTADKLKRYKNESMMYAINLTENAYPLPHHPPQSPQTEKLKLLYHSKIPLISRAPVAPPS